MRDFEHRVICEDCRTIDVSVFADIDLALTALQEHGKATGCCIMAITVSAETLEEILRNTEIPPDQWQRYAFGQLAGTGPSILEGQWSESEAPLLQHG